MVCWPGFSVCEEAVKCSIWASPGDENVSGVVFTASFCFNKKKTLRFNVIYLILLVILHAKEDDDWQAVCWNKEPSTGCYWHTAVRMLLMPENTILEGLKTKLWSFYLKHVFCVLLEEKWVEIKHLALICSNFYADFLKPPSNCNIHKWDCFRVKVISKV